jgi:catechol 2,3-dioxygenase-like lactoylglutathione lyase family enzyme
MPEVADVFRRFGGGYLAAHGAAMLPSHRRAIADIIACRTEALGGQQWCCNDCGALLHVFYSCRNRACPKCHAEQTQAWLEQRREEMLPVPYFHVTVTVPEELRAALRRHQIDGYGALIKAAAEAIIVLARDPRWVGGTVGVLAVLHTWTQRLVFHPHVHCLVTGGGLSDDGVTWHPAGKTFLFPKSALAALVRARFRDAFARLRPDVDLPRHVWQIPWVVHITPWGQGQQAALDYLARYAFRIAITNSRILDLDAETVTYRYKDRAADRHRTETVSGHEFIRRFLQHVLPAGFHKVRYYGLWHAARRDPARNLRNLLLLQQPAVPTDEPAIADQIEPDPPSRRRCPQCQSGHLTLLRRLSPARPQGP